MATPTARKAKTRLSDLTTQEVSLVTTAANLRRWIVIKGQDTMKIEKALSLPSTARQTILDGIAQVLEALSGLGNAVSEAEVDDAAPIPPELLDGISQCAVMLSGIAEQFTPAPEQQQSQEQPTQETPAQEEKSATCEHCGSVITAQKSAEISKAGRKIASKRLKALKDLSEQLFGVIKDLEADPEDVQKSADNDLIASLRSQVSELNLVMKSLKEGFTAPVAKSNASPTDKQPTQVAKTVWPSDMSIRKSQTK